MNVDDAANSLAAILPHQTSANLRALLSKQTKYVELDRQLSPKQHVAILQLGIPGVYFAKGMTRIYPRGQTAAHILGAVYTDHIGIAALKNHLTLHYRLVMICSALILAFKPLLAMKFKNKLIVLKPLAVLALFWTCTRRNSRRGVKARF